MDNKEFEKYNISNGLPQSTDKIVLTDCMDTILYRDITLDYLLALWAKKVGREFNIYPKFLLYYRREVVKSAMHNTVPVEVIYNDIYNHCRYFGLVRSCSKEEFITKVHQIELDIELRHHHPITETIQYLEKAKSANKPIYCVSDFRLSSSDLKQFFSHLGIDSLFTGIFSSCDVGKTKKTGDFYPYVLNNIQKKPSECLMIGDNMKSDCINAGANGIESHRLMKSKTSTIYALTSKIKTAFILR